MVLTDVDRQALAKPMEATPSKPTGRPPGIIDRRQMLSAVDAMIDELKRVREMIAQFTGK